MKKDTGGKKLKSRPTRCDATWHIQETRVDGQHAADALRGFHEPIVSSLLTPGTACQYQAQVLLSGYEALKICRVTT
jgi:hypothetical protein